MLAFLNFEITALILSIVSSSAAHLFLKVGANEIHFGSLHGVINIWLFLGISLHIVALLLWVFALRTTPISKAYPFLALGYGLVSVGAFFLLGEQLTILNIIGIAIIMVGLFLVLS